MSILKALEGKIDMKSEPGNGSLFRLEPPLPETDELVEEDRPECNPITIMFL